jgi:hypothetical protein
MSDKVYTLNLTLQELATIYASLGTCLILHRAMPDAAPADMREKIAQDIPTINACMDKCHAAKKTGQGDAETTPRTATH